MTFRYAKEKQTHKWHRVPYWKGKLDFSAKCGQMAKTWTYIREIIDPGEATCRNCEQT